MSNREDTRHLENDLYCFNLYLLFKISDSWLPIHSSLRSLARGHVEFQVEDRHSAMRKQYHARQIGPDRYVWDIHRLVRLVASMRPQLVSISAIHELDENWWYQGKTDVPTPRSLAEHMALVRATDLEHPIILCSDGRLMDGMHRLVKALLEERQTILAVKFERTPEPDYVNPTPEELSYGDED